jgi:hypothetical protein
MAFLTLRAARDTPVWQAQRRVLRRIKTASVSSLAPPARTERERLGADIVEKAKAARLREQTRRGYVSKRVPVEARGDN